MDGERKQKIINAAFCFFAGVISCCAVFYLRGGGNATATDAGRNSASAAQQVNRAAELNELAGAENKSAGAAVDRATSNAQRAAELNQRAQEQLATSAELLKQIRADNQRAKQILAELIAGHKAGREADKKN